MRIAMFFRDQEEISGLKDNYFFFINQCYREIRRTNRYEMLATLTNYVKNSDLVKSCLYEDLQIWTDFEMKYKEEKFPIENDNIYNMSSVT